MAKLHTIEGIRDVTICELPKFPGGRSTSTAIGSETTHIQTPLPPAHILEAAWAVTLQLYTRLARVCFQLVEMHDGVGNSTIRSCEIGENEGLGAVQSRLQTQASKHINPQRNHGTHLFNTAVILDTLRSNHTDEVSSPSLRQGIEVALHITESKCALIFRRSFMSAGEARNVAATFAHFLHNIVNDKGKTIREISIAQQDIDQIIAWNSDDLIPIDRQGIVHHQFSNTAQTHPDRQAIDAWDGNMSYEELDNASTVLAKHLQRKGVGAGSWVLFCFHKSRWAVISILAILKAGGACVPLDPRHPQGRVRQIIQKTGARHAVTGAEDTAALLASSEADLDVVDARKALSPDEEQGDLEAASWPKLTPDSPAMCLFTSGSTGTPKGITIPHGHLCLATQAYRDRFGVDENTRVLQFSAYTFDISAADTFLALFCGATLCIPSEETRVDGLEDYIVQTRTTWANLTPTVSRQLDPAVVKDELHTLVLAGEPVRDSDVEAWVGAGVQMYNVYGPAENTLLTTTIRACKGKVGSNIGYGVNTRTWVVDMDRKSLVPVGVVGELLIESTHLAPGYLDEPEMTRASFLDNVDFIVGLNTRFNAPAGKRRFYRSGDLVRYCEDGSLLYVGRVDGQIKLGGQRIELGDIESHIQGDATAYRTAVFLPSCGPLANKLTAIVCSHKPGLDSSNAMLSLSLCDSRLVSEAMTNLDQSLPSYMVPTIWLGINRFPLSAAGKMDRRTLISLLESLTWESHGDLILASGGDESELDSLNIDQKLLRDACSEVLNIPASKVSLSRSFIALGGDSITAMQVSFAIKKQAKKTISVKDLLSRSSLLEAADRIVMLHSSPSFSSQTVEHGKRFPLSPIQRLFFEMATTPDTWNHYHQSMLMKLEEPRQPQDVEATISAVISRHPMLRARFEKQPEREEWLQYIVPADEASLELDIIDGGTGLVDEEDAMRRARQDINISEGPLIRAQLFTANHRSPKARLFIVVHHLVVDLVSWRTILEEIEVALTITLSASDEASYEESTPFLVWSDLQSRFAKEIRPSRTIPLKAPPPDPNYAYWGLDPSMNVYRDVRETRIILDDAVCQRVLFDCHQALRTEPVDIILAAIILSFKRMFPDRHVPAIFTEGHGREPWNETLDISRTVGWFTTMAPVYVGDMNAGDVLEVVRRVKDYRRGTPNNGFDYFSSIHLNQDGSKSPNGPLPSEVLFNFEGRYQAMEKQQSLLRPEMWQAGETLADQSPDLRRFCLFELAAAVLDGQMHLTCAWNTRTHHQDRIYMWMTGLLPAAIGEISTVLMYAATRQLTLSDVELLELEDYPEIDELMAAVLSIPGVSSIDDVDDILPGSPIQNSLGLSQLKTADGAYEVEMTWEVTSRGLERGSSVTAHVDPDVLASAWKETVARHAMLRTVILEATNADCSMIHQVVLKRFQPDCIFLEAKDTAHGIELLEAYPLYADKGLFSDKKPPHRLLICRTLEGTLVRLQINHIVFDGMSTLPLLRDLAQSYMALASGRKAHIMCKNIPSLYPGFLRYMLDTSRRESSLAYWKKYLAGAAPCYFPALVTSSCARLESQKHVGDKQQRQQRGQVPVHLDVGVPDLQAALQRLEVTLSSLFQTVWALLLRAYTGGNQSVFGYLASGRDVPVDGIEDAIGPFISMLVCYVDFSRNRDLGVEDIIKSVQRASADSISHQGISLAEIQNALEVPGSLRLFNSGLTILPRMTTDMQIKEEWELLFNQVSLRDPTEYELSLIVETGDQVGDDISLHLDYLESSISKEYAVNIAATVNHIVTKLIRTPSAKIDDLVDLSHSDWNKIKSWNQSLIEPIEECMHGIFARRVREHPEREAIYSWDGSLTYKELDDLSDVLAKRLVASYRVQVEQMIPVCFEKSLWTIVSILAVLKAGGCFVLLDPSQPESRLWTIIDDVEASVMLCSPLANKSKDLKAKAGERSREMTILEVDGAFFEKIQSLGTSAEHTDIQLDQIPVGPDNAMYVVFTSGTTGTPKGAVATHKALVTGLHEQAEVCGMVALGSNVRSLQFASYTFDASLGDIFTTMQAGGCLCIPRDEDRSPADITTFMSRSRTTYAGITSSFASLLNPASIPTLKALVVGGEPLSASLIEAWSDRVMLTNMYGPTEGTVGCIANTHISKTTSASNIGRGYRTATWVVDPDNHGRLQPIGAIGELLIEGPILCRGYLKRPEQTAKVFINGPPWLAGLRPGSRLYKTGDLVRYDADGALIFVGRKDTQIKINGQRVEIGEIEHALRSCLNVSREGPVVVDLLKRGELGEADLLTAFVCVGRSGVDDSELISKSRESMTKIQMLVKRFQHPTSAVSSLPQYMIPQAHVPLSRLPLTPSGKVDRRALQQACAQMSRNDLLAIGSLASPSTVVKDTSDLVGRAEKRLAQIWEKVLQVKGVSRSSNFFRLGGNSMSALGLRAEARRCGLSLSVADIFAHPVLTDMAILLFSGDISSVGLSSTSESVSEDLASSQSQIAVSAESSASDYASSAVDTETDMVKPFSLLELQGDSLVEEIKEVARSCNVSPDEVEDLFPSTPMQEALMVLASNRESRGAYGMHAPFKLPKDLNKERFQSAWEKTTAAHSILRSRVVSRRGRSYVVVTKSTIPVRQVSVSSLSEYLKAQEEDHFEHGSSLCRLSIAHDDQDGCEYFIFSAHHAIYDGWSVRLIFNTFLSIHRDGVIPHGGPPFREFARELCLMDKPEAEEYWRGALTENDEEGFEFPIYPQSHKPVVRSNYRVDNLPFNPAVAPEMGVTITTLFHAAWALTLAQYTASQIVSFGVTLQGRDFPMADVESVVGPTIVTVPRQLNVIPEQSVVGFLQAVHGVTVASLRYQHLGLHQIQALGPVARTACDFSSLLAVNNSVGDDFHSSLKAVGIVPVDIEAPDFHPYPLVLECFAGREHFNLRVGFDPECIDEAMVSRVMLQFQHNLQSICEASSSSDSPRAMNLATVMEDVAPSHVQTILEWTDTSRSLTDPTQIPTVLQLLERRAREHPSDLAIVAHDTPGMTYADLINYIDALALRIRHLGLTSKDAPFVALCIHNSATAIVCMLAVIKAGAAFMPLNPSQPQARLRSLAEKANVRLALVSPSCHDMFNDVQYLVLPVDMDEIIREHAQNQSVSFHDTDTDTDTKEAIVIDSTDVAYLIYTSGTSGNPKGVVMEHGAWASQMLALMAFFKLGPGTRMLQFARYNFDACLLEVYIALLSGACVCIPSYEEKMNNLEGYLLEYDVNAVMLTPTVARMLNPRNLRQVKFVTLGGEALTQSDIDAWTNPGRRVINAYGPSETCLAVNAREVMPATGPFDKLNTCNNIGHAIGAAEWIVNPSQKTALVPIGAVGELLIEGPSLAQGYHNDPERTRLSFPDHILERFPGQQRQKGVRMYCSGDLVRLVSDGSFEYMGRRDGQVKLRGQRIDVGEIEYHIHSFMSNKPEFRSASVQLYKPKAREEDTAGSNLRVEPYLVALLVMEGVPFTQEVLGVPCQLVPTSQHGGSETEMENAIKDLRRTLRSLLPDNMVPSAFITLARLPLAPTGKLDRSFIQTCLHELSREPLSAKTHLYSQVHGEPSHEEALLQKWWASLLGLDTQLVGSGSDFFAVGGNSVTAMRLVWLARSYQYTLRHEDIFKYPILSDMAICLKVILQDEVRGTGASHEQNFDIITETDAHSLLCDALPLYGISWESVQDVYPCTPLQENLMAATSRHPGAYTMVEAIDVPTTQLRITKRAWAAVFQAFDILRTTIIPAPERGALQVVLKSHTLEWQEVSSIDQFLGMVRESTDYGLPLARLAVLDRTIQCHEAGGENMSRILFGAHHAVYDAVFVANMWQRLAHEMSRAAPTTENARGRGHAKTVTPFKTFIRHMLNQDLGEAEAFWQEKLAGLSNSMFPPRPCRSGTVSERTPLATQKISRSLTIPKAKDQNTCNRGHGIAVTVATVAHAAWALTISHYTANHDTLFGATLSGREAAAASISDPESIAGPTITTVPYRTVVDYDSTVSSFLTRVQQDTVRTVRFGQLGLEQIARISEDCRRACRFESIFQVIQSSPSGADGNNDVESSLGLVHHRALDVVDYFPTPLAVEVQLSEDANDAVIYVIYDPLILQGSLPELILDTLATILSNLLQAAPEAPLTSVSALSAHHLSEIMPLGHKPSEDTWVEEYCIHALVRKQVEREPLLPAIDSWDGLMSYTELDHLSSSLAATLILHGIGPEKPVCLLFEKSKWAIVAMLGIAKAGGCFVPLDPKHPRQRLEFLVETSNSTVVLTSSQNLPLCGPLPCRAIVVDETMLPTPTVESLRLGPPPLLQVPVEPHNAAYILFTSGSTGTPKGVVVEHKALSSTTAAFSRRMRYGKDSRVLQFNSYWFDPVLLDIFCTLTHGGCICVPSENDRINDLEGVINRFNADSIIMAPSVSRAIEPSRVPSLKTVCLGGEAILPSDAARWSSKVRLTVGYGPTETCIVSAFGELKPFTASNILGESVACRNWVVNPIKGSELAPFGAVGELWTEGPNLARGYFGDEKKTADSFIVNPPWMPQTLHVGRNSTEGQGDGDSSHRVYKTGDLVYFNPDGTLSFVGRMGSSQVKIRGQRVELEEIEETIRKLIPSSMRVAVDVFHAPEDQDQTNQTRRAVLGAVFAVGRQLISSHGGLDITDPQVSSFMDDLAPRLSPILAGSLPSHMLPEVYVPLAEIPLSTSGKLDRRALQKTAGPLALSLALGASAAVATRQSPSTAMEKSICNAWVKVLGIKDEDAVSRWDNFISLGGDSILAMRLVAVLRSVQVSLTVVNIFKHPTLADMSTKARYFGGESESEADDSKAVNPNYNKSNESEQLILHDQSITSPATKQSILESIHPCTDYQKMFIHGANAFSNAHGVQLIFSLDGTLSISRLHAAFDHCATWYPTLRTRIVPDVDSGTLVQVVSPINTKVCWRHFNTNSESFETIAAEDKNSPPAVDGRPLHRISVVFQAGKSSTTKAILIWHLHHAAYDGWTIGMMLQHIEQAYMDPSCEPSHVLPFSRFVDKARASSMESRSFWEAYLDGIKPARLLFNYAAVKEPRQNCRAIHRVSLPARRHRGATAATVIIAAWALVLARVTKSRDIVLAHLVTGRTMPLPGIETCPGPTINKVPLRIRLPEEPEPLPDLDAVTAIVSSELVRVMPYEQGGLAAIENLIPTTGAGAVLSIPHAGTLLGRLPLDLGIHPKGHLDFAGGVAIGIQQLDMRPTAPPPGGFSVECKLLSEPEQVHGEATGLEIASLWDNRAANEGDIERLVGLFENILATCT
ncbi:aps1, partial [Metarhizium majus ARSEF 297]